MGGPDFTGKAWRVAEHDGFNGLKLEEESMRQQIGDQDCIVKLKAASLNYRDLMVANGTYPWAVVDNVVPGSDGAGTVVSIGPQVTRFKKGDNVCTTLLQSHIAGSMTMAKGQIGTGASVDGTLRQNAVFNESSLVAMPDNLSFREASTLPCAALTAWNVLYGLAGRAVKPGDTVLTLGTGGVSLFAVQFAVAAGATVLATTSSAEKGRKLKEMGATHVINYREDAFWGETAKKLTPSGEGVNFIVEVGGATTLEQSLKAIRLEGIICIVGSIGSAVGTQGQPGLLSAWQYKCVVRGIMVGSRLEFEEMNRAIVAKDMKPLVDAKPFKLDQLKEACQYMKEQRNFGKVVVDCQ